MVEEIAGKFHSQQSAHAIKVDETLEGEMRYSDSGSSASASLKPRRRTERSVPVRMTTSAVLRERKLKSELEEKEKQLKIAFQKQKQRQHQKEKIHKEICQKFRIKEGLYTSKQDMEAKRRAFRLAEACQQEEYRNELQEMKKRIELQPLLIEKQLLFAARCKVEKQYKTRIQSVGLNVDFVQRMSNKCNAVITSGLNSSGSNVPSAQDDDDTKASSFDNTATKESGDVTYESISSKEKKKGVGDLDENSSRDSSSSHSRNCVSD